MKKLFALLTVAAVIASASLAQAAVINVQPVISGVLDPTTFEPVAGATFQPKSYGGGQGEVVLQIDFTLTVESLAAGEDSFGTAAFSMETTGTGGATVARTLAYGARSFPLVDVNGTPPPGANTPLFATNADQATSDDYVGILLQAATGAFTNATDPRRNVGEPTGVTLPSGENLGPGMWFGQGYVLYNGLGTGAISIVGSLPGTGPEVSAKLVDGTFALGTASAVVPITLGGGGPPIIPEPTTLAMAGMSLIGLVLRRRNG